jgi:hypothetical protein
VRRIWRGRGRGGGGAIVLFRFDSILRLFDGGLLVEGLSSFLSILCMASS